MCLCNLTSSAIIVCCVENKKSKGKSSLAKADQQSLSETLYEQEHIEQNIPTNRDSDATLFPSESVSHGTESGKVEKPLILAPPHNTKEEID